MAERNGNNTFFRVSSLDPLSTETHSTWLPTRWSIWLMFRMQCSWIINHFDSFISMFWRIKFSSTYSPRINRLSSWSLYQTSTFTLDKVFVVGSIFGLKPIRFPVLTPHKLNILSSWVNTPITNNLFCFMVVLPHLVAWDGIGSVKKKILWYLSMKQYNSPKDSIYLSDSKTNTVPANSSHSELMNQKVADVR